MNHRYYGWVTEQPRPGWNVVDLYGWGTRVTRSAVADQPPVATEACVACGAEFAVQRTGVLYECEKCMNLAE